MRAPVQFSLAWLLTETAFFAIACAGLKLAFFSGRIAIGNYAAGLMLVWIAGCGAIGGVWRSDALGFAYGAFVGFIVGIVTELVVPVVM
jgi:hypothetical protein